MRLAGVLILYNPSNEVLDNILTYLDGLEILYVLDNSERPNITVIDRLKMLPKIYYVAFGKNKGISYALNYALELTHGYQFLLTMDQDSKFRTGEFSTYKEKLDLLKDSEPKIAIYSINYVKNKLHRSPCEYVTDTITSGSIIDIGVAKEVGGFDLNLFIDQVDLEYCYRVREFGYRIIVFYDLFLLHHLGNPKQYNIFGRTIQVTNHNAGRRYYIVRNMLYVMRRYKDIRRDYAMEILKMTIKVVLFEEDKCKKLLYMYRGIDDYLHGKFGKYDYRQFIE